MGINFVLFCTLVDCIIFLIVIFALPKGPIGTRKKGNEEIKKYLKLHDFKKVSLTNEQITKLTGELKTE